MAKADEDQDTINESPVWRTILILAGLVLVIFGAYYLFAGGDSQDVATGDEAVVSDQKEPEDKRSKVVQSEEAKQVAASQAQAAANRGEVSQTLASETDEEFSYVVGSGESYTGLARQAVTATDDSLTPAERVAAETKLTQDAGADYLAAGQEVSLSKSTVKAAVAWARGLSAEQKAAWQPYADLVAW